MSLRLTPSACALGALLLARSAAADEAPIAEAIFDEGVRLLGAGRVDEACTALDRAVGLAGGAAIGGLLALADCRERQGRSASAWATYRRAVAAARQQHDPREAKAAAAVARLDPTLPRVRVRVPEALATRAGVTVTLRGDPWPREAWGVAVPVDPGDASIEAEIPGAPRWKMQIHVAPSAATVTIDIPTPAEAPRTAAPATPPVRGLRPLGVAGVVVGSAGAVALGASLGVIASARARYASALADPANHCDRGACNTAGKQQVDAARRQGDAATGLSIAGAVALAGGGALLVVDLVTRPRAPAPEARSPVELRLSATSFTLGVAFP